MNGRLAWAHWNSYLNIASNIRRLDAQAHIAWLEQQQITNIRPGETLSGVVEIQGSAFDDDFLFYKLEYGAGKVPTEWVAIGDIYTTRVENNILGHWDTSGVSSGTYTLRLTLVYADGNFAPHDLLVVHVE